MNKTYIQPLALGIILLLAPIITLAATASTWQIVPTDSNITFTAAQNGSPIPGQFKTFSGTLNFDPTQLNNSHVHIIINIGSINTAYKEVANTLQSADWFDTKLFPQAIFDASQFVKTGDNTYQANGKLTIRDKTIPITLAFILDQYTTNKAHAKGSTILKRTQFGLGKGDWAKTDAIKDEVKVEFNLTAVK